MADLYKPYYNKSWALVIGINQYDYVSPLTYACNDADAICNVLSESINFPLENITVLKDAAATKSAILEEFHNLIHKANDPNDRVLLFYAGHGHTMSGPKGAHGFLVPVDGNIHQTHTLIRWAEFTQLADLIPAKHILFIMDACYSGLAVQRGLQFGTQRFVSDMLQRSARQVITAGKADETVADGGGPQGQNSIFTGHLLEGLAGKAMDDQGVLTANALMHYLYQTVAKDRNSHQTPHYGHIDGDGDFILCTPNQEHLQNDATMDLQILPFIEHPDIQPIPSNTINPINFTDVNGYNDPSNTGFGVNTWTSKLGELVIPKEVNMSSRYQQARSWITIIVEPLMPIKNILNISEIIPSMRKINYIISGSMPYQQFVVPYLGQTTSKSVIFHKDMKGADQPYWDEYIRIDNKGAMEYVSSEARLFYDFRGERRFDYVQIIGSVWKFMFFAQHILKMIDYTSYIRLSLNLVGTENSVLVGFSKEKGEGGRVWPNPEEPSNRYMEALLSQSPIFCVEPNIQIQETVMIGTLDEPRSSVIIQDIAHQIGLAYNHQSNPRCFNYNTTIFPWNQYDYDQR